VPGDEDVTQYGTPIPAEGGLYVVGYGSLTAFKREARRTTLRASRTL